MKKTRALKSKGKLTKMTWAEFRHKELDSWARANKIDTSIDLKEPKDLNQPKETPCEHKTTYTETGNIFDYKHDRVYEVEMTFCKKCNKQIKYG